MDSKAAKSIKATSKMMTNMKCIVNRVKQMD